MQKVTPYEVEGNIDYVKLIKQFGVEPLDENLLEELRKRTKSKTLHPFFRRGLFVAHRDLKWLLKQIDSGKPFYLYTGRGPSGNVHLGHTISWIVCQWLQKEFDAHVVFQLTDDEKYLFNKQLSREETYKLAQENAIDFLSCGFDIKKTHIIIDTEQANTMYPLALDVAKKITFSTVKAMFGFQNDTNIGAVFYTAMQAVPAFIVSAVTGKNVACLIPHGIDQDPHFRATRDVLPKLGYNKPASVQCTFLPPLQGAEGKMSSSDTNTAIYLSDSPAQIKKKINKYAFSGGQATVEEHREKGGNPDVDVAYQYLRYFMDDDAKLLEIYEAYKSGELLTGDLKKECIVVVSEFVTQLQQQREKVAPVWEKALFSEERLKKVFK